MIDVEDIIMFFYMKKVGRFSCQMSKTHFMDEINLFWISSFIFMYSICVLLNFIFMKLSNCASN